MPTYLTQQQLQLHAPISISDFASAKFEPFVTYGLREILRTLPKTMQPVIKSLDFTGKPELQAYWIEYLQPWLAQQVYLDMALQGGVNVTQDGVRTVTEQYSLEAANNLKADAFAQIKKQVQRFKQDAMTRYTDVRYVFDNIAYPPTANMEGYWNDGWAGLTYGLYNGQWGWYGMTGNWIGFDFTNLNSANNWSVTMI